MPELTIHTGGNAAFEDAFYSMGQPAAFSPPSSPASGNRRPAESSGSTASNLRQVTLAAATAAERLSAACCTTRTLAPSQTVVASELECVDGYSFLDPQAAWLTLTCCRNPSTRNVSTVPSSAAYLGSTRASIPSAAPLGLGQQLHQTQPYSAAECYRIVEQRHVSNDSGNSYTTFAPKKPLPPDEVAAPVTAAAPATQTFNNRPTDCGSSVSSGESPLLPAELKHERGVVGCLYTPGSAVLIQGGQNGKFSLDAAASPGSAAFNQGGPAAAGSPGAAASREAYIVSAAKRISETQHIKRTSGN